VGTEATLTFETIITAIQAKAAADGEPLDLTVLRDPKQAALSPLYRDRLWNWSHTAYWAMTALLLVLGLSMCGAIIWKVLTMEEPTTEELDAYRAMRGRRGFGGGFHGEL
jgi:hypothetical protein